MHRLTKDVGPAAEQPLPESVADDDADFTIVDMEPAPHDRADTKHVGQTRRRPANLQPLALRIRSVSNGCADAGDPEHAHLLEHAIVFADEEVAPRIRTQLLLGLIWRREPHDRDAIDIRVWKRTPKRLVDEAEDQGIRPDPEAETADCRQRKRRSAPERASR